MSKLNRHIHRGANLIEAERVARDLGCIVAPIKGTGEIRFKMPGVPHSIKVNGRRKGTTRALAHWLNKLQPNGEIK